MSAHYSVALLKIVTNRGSPRSGSFTLPYLTITIWPPMTLLVIVARVELMCYCLLDVQDSWFYTKRSFWTFNVQGEDKIYLSKCKEGIVNYSSLLYPPAAVGLLKGSLNDFNKSGNFYSLRILMTFPITYYNWMIARISPLVITAKCRKLEYLNIADYREVTVVL